MKQMKKRGLVLLIAAALGWGLGSRSSEALTISRTFLENEHYADVTAIHGGLHLPYKKSTAEPYASAELTESNLWAFNRRGIKSQVSSSRTEGDLIWTDTMIAFGGESGYDLQSSGAFFDSISGNSLTKVSYELSLSGGSGEVNVLFSLASYDNDYPDSNGFDSWNSITLKHPDSTTLLQWQFEFEADLDQLPSKIVPLASGEIYTLLIESHGDFSSGTLHNVNAEGTFSSSAVLSISVPELTPVPAPDSLVLLASALAIWFPLRKKIRLFYSFIL